MSLFRAGFYIFAGFIPFRSVQAGVWGWYLGTPRAGKTFTSSGFWNQDKDPQELPWKSLLAVSPFLPTCSPMSCLLPVSSSHSQPINLVMPCVCLKSHTGRAASSASLPCQRQHPILPAAARVGILPLQAEKSPLSYNPVQPSPLQTCQYLHPYFVGVFVKLFISIHCLAS